MLSGPHTRRGEYQVLVQSPKNAIHSYHPSLPTIEHFSSEYQMTYHEVNRSGGRSVPNKEEEKEAKLRQMYQLERKLGNTEMRIGEKETGKQTEKGNGGEAIGTVLCLKGNNGNGKKESEGVLGGLEGEGEGASNDEEMDDLSPLTAEIHHSSLIPNTDSVHSPSSFERKRSNFLFESKPKVLFRPRLLNHKAAIQLEVPPPSFTLPPLSPSSTPLQQQSARKKHTKPTARHLSETTQLQTLVDTHSVLSETAASNLSTAVLPVLRLTKIESCELDSSDTEIEPVSPFAATLSKRKSKPKRLRKSMGDSSDVYGYEQILSDYKQKTADVLDGTKTILKRRSERMIVPARLLKITHKD